MADSDGGESDGAASSQGSGGAGVDPTSIDKLSEKDQKKWNKNLLAWRMFIDFIFRHIAIVTFKYNNFERDNMQHFLIAVDKAEALRMTVKLKKSETPNITSFRTLRDSTGVLQERHFYREADLILQLVDLCGRMRCLCLIGGGFYKSLKKGNVRGIDNIKRSLDFWKGFCLRGYDYGELQFKNADVESFSAVEKKHLSWSTAIRTSINMSQQFLKRASDATGLQLISEDPTSIQVSVYETPLIGYTYLFDGRVGHRQRFSILSGFGHFSYFVPDVIHLLHVCFQLSPPGVSRPASFSLSLGVLC